MPANQHSDQPATTKQVRYLRQLATERSESFTEDDLHCTRCASTRIGTLAASPKDTTDYRPSRQYRR